MESQDLSPEEREIVRRFRQLDRARKQAVKASEDAFIEFLQTIKMIVEIWHEIAPIIRELWDLIQTIF